MVGGILETLVEEGNTQVVNVVLEHCAETLIINIVISIVLH